MRSLRDLQSLEGKVALITGGAGHIAAAAGEALAELGCRLALVDKEQTVETIASTLTRHTGLAAAGLVSDLEREDQVRALPGRVADRFGRLDIIVHCAALVSADDLPGWTVDFEAQRADTWRRALEVNVTAPFVLTQAAAGLLRSARGSVITIGSIYGRLGPDLRLYAGTTMGNAAGYAASKGGLAQLTRWLATVLAPDVRVNMISLGGIERAQPEPFRRRYAERTPLGRMGTEEDVKGALAFLATDASAYVTGQTLTVDGGFGVW